MNAVTLRWVYWKSSSYRLRLERSVTHGGFGTRDGKPYECMLLLNLGLFFLALIRFQRAQLLLE